MNKVEQFIQLQNEINNDIDTKGQTTSEKADALDTLGDSLSDVEIDELCEKERAKSMYEQGLRHY
jgi:uncharacterized protein YoxC